MDPKTSVMLIAITLMSAEAEIMPPRVDPRTARFTSTPGCPEDAPRSIIMIRVVKGMSALSSISVVPFRGIVTFSLLKTGTVSAPDVNDTQ
jgi:hypothetical protein